jgi:8-oxo-dGTP pyrophosphatase MutT (NUDIX family)
MPGESKACPVVVRGVSGRQDVLAFRHPLAGKQLVKGTVEAGETIEDAAIRELFEESGLPGEVIKFLGPLYMREADQQWHFVLCQTGQLPEVWTHHTSDGGGLDFAFFWHSLAEEPNEDWHPIFQRALVFIRAALLDSH